ncbi:hypothetical protein ACFFX0_10700 [Citricoccus parietis]|uniref:Uncharacterized protein n=1 Tax=Citricoccus parietis TaxID=592307 RepID=A0ABV5FY74_9MICC
MDGWQAAWWRAAWWQAAWWRSDARSVLPGATGSVRWFVTPAESPGPLDPGEPEKPADQAMSACSDSSGWWPICPLSYGVAREVTSVDSAVMGARAGRAGQSRQRAEPMTGGTGPASLVPRRFYRH